MPSIDQFRRNSPGVVAVFLVLSWLPWLLGLGSVTTFKLEGIQSGTANFGNIPRGGFTGVVSRIQGDGCTVPSEPWSHAEQAIAMVDSGSCSELLVVAMYEELGYSGVIFVSQELMDTRPMRSIPANVKVGIPSVRVGQGSARHIEAKGTAKFLRVVTNFRGLCFGMLATLCAIYFLLLPAYSAYSKSKGDSTDTTARPSSENTSTSRNERPDSSAGPSDEQSTEPAAGSGGDKSTLNGKDCKKAS